MLTKYRLSLAAIGTLAAVLLVAGWFLGVQPQLTKALKANEQTAAARTQNDLLVVKNAGLKADQERISEFQAQLAQKQVSIPSARSQQELITQITAAADSAGVDVTNVSFEQARRYVPPAAVPVPATTSTLVAVTFSIAAGGERAGLEQFAANMQAINRLATITQSQYTGPEAASLVLGGQTWVLQPPK